MSKTPPLLRGVPEIWDLGVRNVGPYDVRFSAGGGGSAGRDRAWQSFPVVNRDSMISNCQNFLACGAISHCKSWLCDLKLPKFSRLRRAISHCKSDFMTLNCPKFSRLRRAISLLFSNLLCSLSQKFSRLRRAYFFFFLIYISIILAWTDYFPSIFWFMPAAGEKIWYNVCIHQKI